MTTFEDFANWFTVGRERGWISELACSTHDGTPWTPEEEVQWDDGFDPCAFIVRVWEPS